MKTTLTLIMALLCGLASAQEYKARQPTPTETRRAAAGLANYGQDVFTRDHTPVWVVNALAYTVTNSTDGVILCKTNATVIVRVGLPNPTNNIGRVFRVGTMGACTAVLTNTTFVGSFTAANTMAEANQLLISSNKLAMAFSTGTNYVVFNYN